MGRPVTFAIGQPADITPGPLSFSLDGLTFDVRTPRGTLHVRSKLVGRPNVYNILAAVATGVALDLPFDAIERGVHALDGVPGRFQVVSERRKTASRSSSTTRTPTMRCATCSRRRGRWPAGRLITVFGCGGDRDRTKRPLMGAVAGRLSDLIIVTSDNPRSEDPDRIIEEIQRGITPDTRRDSGQRLLSIVDRREAIEKAIELAQPGDVVLIAGKGHEKYQVIGDAGAAVRRRGGGARGARETPDQLGRRMTATDRPGPVGSGSEAGSEGPALQPEIRLTAEWVAACDGRDRDAPAIRTVSSAASRSTRER